MDTATAKRDEEAEMRLREWLAEQFPLKCAACGSDKHSHCSVPGFNRRAAQGAPDRIET